MGVSGFGALGRRIRVGASGLRNSGFGFGASGLVNETLGVEGLGLSVNR